MGALSMADIHMQVRGEVVRIRAAAGRPAEGLQAENVSPVPPATSCGTRRIAARRLLR